MLKRFNLQIFELYRKAARICNIANIFSFFIYYNRLCSPMLETSLDNLLILLFKPCKCRVNAKELDLGCQQSFTIVLIFTALCSIHVRFVWQLIWPKAVLLSCLQIPFPMHQSMNESWSC